MPRKKKQTLVHFDIDSLSKQTEQKEVNPPTSLGQTLRAKREKKKLSIEDVARKLCIKEVYINALEEGHYYAFPSRVYGIGFLRSYAKFLGLDSDLMVAEFHAETSDLKEAPLDMPIIEKHLALPSKKTLALLGLIILLVIILWFTIAALISADLFSKIAEPKLQELEQPEVSLTTEAPVVADEALNFQQPENINQEEVKLEEPKQEQNIKKEKELNAAALKAKAAFVANGDVWVRLYNTQTQKVILEKVLTKNDSFVPEADLSTLQISTGRAKLISLYINGEKVKTFGEEKNRSLSDFASKD